MSEIGSDDEGVEYTGPVWAGHRPEDLSMEQNDILRKWEPRTRLGRLVRDGQVTSIDAALATRLPLREVQVVDLLMPELEDDIIKVNMVQRMTDSGRRVRFHVMACVGNRDGYVGIGIAKGKEVAPTIRKSISVAKLEIMRVMRGNGSWESGSGPAKSVPFAVTGRCGSTRVTLRPAPAGKGLVIGEIGRKVLDLAGIEDVWSQSRGQTRTRINFAQAVFNALKQLNATKLSPEHHDRLQITVGRGGN